MYLFYMTFTAKLKIFWKSVSLHYTVPGGGKWLSIQKTVKHATDILSRRFNSILNNTNSDCYLLLYICRYCSQMLTAICNSWPLVCSTGITTMIFLLDRNYSSSAHCSCWRWHTHNQKSRINCLSHGIDKIINTNYISLAFWTREIRQ